MGRASRAYRQRLVTGNRPARRAPCRGSREARAAGPLGCLRLRGALRRCAELCESCALLMGELGICEWELRVRRRSTEWIQSSKTRTLREKPIQKAMPKNCAGEMGEACGGEEDAHDRARGGDAEQDGDGAEFPAAFAGRVGLRADRGQARQSETRKSVLKKRTAERSVHPPTE